MNMDKYLRAVRRRLDMPRDVKDRVMNDFASSIDARREAGLDDDAIAAELGTAKAAAKELNEQMKEYTYRKSPWRWACLALAIFSGLCLAHKGLTGLLLALFNKAYNAGIGVIGGADGPTSIFITTTGDGQLANSAGTYILLLAMGVIGFFALRKIERK